MKILVTLLAAMVVVSCGQGGGSQGKSDEIIQPPIVVEEPESVPPVMETEPYIVKVFDPCGVSLRVVDEVFLFYSDGSVTRSDECRSFEESFDWTPQIYITSDDSFCQFHILPDGQVYDERLLTGG